VGPIESNANYPLSSEPAAGYGSDPATRNGEVILTNALNGKYIKVTADGYEHVTDRAEATRFADHSAAALKAGELVTAAKAKQAASQQDKLAA